jgi:hypothetical protein
MLADLGAKYGQRRVYQDFCAAYALTTSKFSDKAVSLILGEAKEYGQDEGKYAYCFACIYMGMIAEENKAGTRLGKRIKRLAIHQILCEGMSVASATNFSRGMKWPVLDQLCRSKGF